MFYLPEGYSPIAGAIGFDVQFNFLVLVFKLSLDSQGLNLFLYPPMNKLTGELSA